MTNLKKIISTLALSSVILVCNNANAQQKTLDSNTINIIAPYNPVVSDAVKISSNPAITDTFKKITDLNYFIKPNKIENIFEVEPIKAAKLKNEPIEDISPVYLKAGWGNYTTPYGEAFISSNRAKDYNYALHYKHLSSTGKLPNVGNNDYSNNVFNASATKYMETKSLYGGIDFSRDIYNYYGYNPSVYGNTLDKDFFRQRYLYSNVYVGSKNLKDDTTKMTTDLYLRYYNLTSMETASENGVQLIFKNRKYLHWLKKAKYHIFDYIGDVQFYNNNNVPYWKRGENGLLVRLIKIDYVQFGKLKILFGHNTPILIDPITKKNVWFILLADFNYPIIKDKLHLFFGTTGDMTRNSYFTMVTKNPFVDYNLPMYITYSKHKQYFGFKSEAMKDFSYRIAMYNGDVVNLPMFINTNYPKIINGGVATFNNKFQVILDTGRVSQLSLELTYNYTNMFKLICKFDQYSYDLNHETRAWHHPSMVATVSGNLKAGKKLTLKCDFVFMGETYAKVFDDLTNTKYHEQKLNGIADINIGADFQIDKNLSAFVNLYNVASQKYQQYYNYPLQQFSVLGGFGYRF